MPREAHQAAFSCSMLPAFVSKLLAGSVNMILCWRCGNNGKPGEGPAQGTLVPPHDAPALASAIRTYIRDPGLRRRHREAGRALVLRDFRQQALWQVLHELYVH